MIDYHISVIINVTTLTHNSSEDLQQLNDTFFNHLAALKAVNEPVEYWDTVMCYWLISQMNAKRTALIKFLDDHCKY